MDCAAYPPGHHFLNCPEPSCCHRRSTAAVVSKTRASMRLKAIAQHRAPRADDVIQLQRLGLLRQLGNCGLLILCRSRSLSTSASLRLTRNLLRHGLHGADTFVDQHGTPMHAESTCRSSRGMTAAMARGTHEMPSALVVPCPDSCRISQGK